MKPFCDYGHARTPKNLTPSRQCKQCVADRKRTGPRPPEHRKVKVYCGPWRAGISITAYAFQLQKFGYTRIRFHQKADGSWWLSSFVEPVLEAAA